MKLSIVTTLYKSERFIEQFLEKCIEAAEKYGGDFEIIVVDDGSPDRSRQLAEAYADTDNRIRVIELSRNFGHHAAFLCGMHYACGERCFLIDSDLEVDPATLVTFKGEDGIFRCRCRLWRAGNPARERQYAHLWRTVLENIQSVFRNQGPSGCHD